ncbi:hypothetical protein GCM10010310_56520 [Streptomyces violaceolatus]|uniref:Uncharacterized protein n=1 Tax=Streptomyces violaceolatus TaxID=67378 RepID=A0ABN3T8K5_9ACTN
MTHTRTHEELIYPYLQSLQSLQAFDNPPDLRFCLCRHSDSTVAESLSFSRCPGWPVFEAP